MPELSLPDGQALELLGRALELVAGVPVVVLSGHAHPVLAAQMIDLGARGDVVRNLHAAAQLQQTVARLTWAGLGQDDSNLECRRGPGTGGQQGKTRDQVRHAVGEARLCGLTLGVAGERELVDPLGHGANPQWTGVARH